jgi:hypothetical protein
MHDAPRRHTPREAPHEAPREDRRHRAQGRIGRRRHTPTMPTPPKRWPAAANAARHKTMRNQERIAQITRELLRDPRINNDNALARLVYEAQALAEQSRRELGEARAEE